MTYWIGKITLLIERFNYSGKKDSKACILVSDTALKLLFEDFDLGKLLQGIPESLPSCVASTAIVYSLIVMKCYAWFWIQTKLCRYAEIRSVAVNVHGFVNYCILLFCQIIDADAKSLIVPTHTVIPHLY